MKKIIKVVSLSLIFCSIRMPAKPQDLLGDPISIKQNASIKKDTKASRQSHATYAKDVSLTKAMTKKIIPTRKSKRHHKKSHKPMPVPMHGDVQTVLEKAFTGISGFGVAGEEALAVTEAGGEPLYGEITYQGLQTILDDLKLTEEDVFYDFGCGVGKVVAYVYLTTPVKKAMGIELCKSRYLGAQKARKRLADSGHVAKNRTLAFTFQDFVKADINDATVVYVLCLSSTLMLKATKKFSKLKNGLRVISLAQLPDHKNYGFNLVKKYSVPMSWMKTGSPMYVYTLEK